MQIILTGNNRNNDSTKKAKRRDMKRREFKILTDYSILHSIVYEFMFIIMCIRTIFFLLWQTCDVVVDVDVVVGHHIFMSPIHRVRKIFSAYFFKIFSFQNFFVMLLLQFEQVYVEMLLLLIIDFYTVLCNDIFRYNSNNTSNNKKKNK